jgi:hypothetical protein
MNEFSHREAVAENAGCLAAEDRADRSTVTKKNDTNAETCDEPQTPAEPN